MPPPPDPGKMLPNPGGLLAVGHVRYRDDFIAALWATLRQRSARIESERRGGKTSVLRKMAAEHGEEWLPVYLDVSGVQSAEEFTDKLLAALAPRRGRWGRAADGVRRTLQSAGHVKLFGKEFGFSAAAGAWKGRLTALARDVTAADPGRTLVLFLDEMPTMLGNLAKTGPAGAAQAMAILDELAVLRRTAPTGPRLRMVFAGSVALHHVLRVLREGGHLSQAVNDMDPLPLPPLRPADAARLAAELLENSGVAADPAACEAIAVATDGFPFYVHAVVDRLVKGGAVTPAAADEAVVAFLTDPHDPWHLRHFLTRLGSYYPTAGDAARAVLDRLAKSDVPLPASELTAAATAAVPGLTADAARGLIDELALDHYVVQGAGGAYGFRFPLLRRWWRLKRDV